MTQPTPYRRGYDFSDAGGAQPPGGPLDGELDDVGLTLSQILRNLALLQRDDTGLRNGIVGIDALDSRVLGLISGGTFSIAGTWATATAYPTGAFFSDDEAIYLTMEAHTSTSIVDDLAAGHIVKVLQNEQGTRLRDDFTGNGVQTAFTLSQSPARPSDVEVYVEGSLVSADAYAQTGSTVTFDVAPTNGHEISIFSITWATTPPIQTLIDAVGNRNAEITAATQFIEDIGDAGTAKGAAMVAYRNEAVGAVDRDVQAVIRDFGVSVADFGAHPSLPDNRAAIQAALDTGAKRIYFPSGSYYCSVNAGPLTVTVDQQHLIGIGDVNIFRDYDGPLLTSAAGDLVIENIAFWGQAQALGYEGDLVVLTGVRARLVRSSCRDAGTDLVLKMTGTRSKIESDKDGYYGNVQIGETGSVCLYPHVSSVYISQTLTLIETGVAKIEGGVIAGINVEIGAGGAGAHGPKLAGVRIVGNLNVKQTFTTVCGGTTVSGNVVVGDGNAISNICFDPSFDQAAGSFTINANVSQSVFFLGAVVDAGLTLTISSPLNQIWHPPIVYTPTLTASAGAPAVGNGSLSATISRYGYERRVAVQLSVGSTTNLGSGAARVSIPDESGSSGIASGAGRIFDSGVGHKPIVAEIAPNTSYMQFYSSSTSGAFGGQTVDNSFPIAFADGDAMITSICYSVK